MGNNAFLKNATDYFNKIMEQKYIAKSDVLQLKNQFKQLKKQDKKYNSFFNKVTNIANNAKGKNEPKILQEVYKEFKELQS